MTRSPRVGDSLRTPYVPVIDPLEQSATQQDIALIRGSLCPAFHQMHTGRIGIVVS